MSFMFELYYKSPEDLRRESELTITIGQLGGRLTCREIPAKSGQGTCCLTYEFDDIERAENAADVLYKLGEHVEGPMDYGPDVPEIHTATAKNSKPRAKKRRATKDTAPKASQLRGR